MMGHVENVDWKLTQALDFEPQCSQDFTLNGTAGLN